MQGMNVNTASDVPVSHCVRCLARSERMDTSREVRGRNGEGHLCSDDDACRRRARRCGMADNPFCTGCGNELVLEDKQGKRPVQCGVCAEESAAARQRIQLRLIPGGKRA